MTSEKIDRLHRYFNQHLTNLPQEWNDLKECLQNVAIIAFWKKQKQQSDWFNENNVEIYALIKDRHQNKKEIQRRIRQLKNDWFMNKANQAEIFYNQNNLREFYSILREVYGSRSKSTHQIRSKNGMLLTTDKEINDRWIEHFSDLLNIETYADMEVLNEIDQMPVAKLLDEPFNEKEFDKVVENMKPGKSSEPDGILPETIKYGGNALKNYLLTFFNQFWITELLLKFILNLNKGYHKGCGTINRIFTVQQLMEKSREQHRNLYITFIDFTKAFDTANRQLLFSILEKIGCPLKLIKLIKLLYINVKARLIVDGELSKLFEYNSGVKQGCKLAPTLFGIYAAVLLLVASKDIKHSH